MKKNLLLITSVFVISLTNAQIQYTDIDPDLTLQATNSDSYALDFNSDNSVDLIIYASEVDTNLNGFVLTFIGGVVNTPGSTEIVGTDSLIFGSNILFVDTIGSGEFIDGALTYISSSMPSVFAGAGIRVTAASLNTSLGEFQGNQDGYIGAKFTTSGNTHFGWVRVNVADDCYSLTIKDFAFQTSPNTGIVAGDYGGSGLVNIDDQMRSKVLISQLYNSIYFDNVQEPTTIQLFNMLGNEIKRCDISSNQRINLDEKEAGLYLIVVSSLNSKQIKKIFIP